MATNRHSLLPEIGPDGLAREAPVIAYTEKIIAEEQLQLRKYIDENYSKIRDVERELANLSFEMKLTAGPKKAALELLRKKIETSTEKIRVAKLNEEQARKRGHNVDQTLTKRVDWLNSAMDNAAEFIESSLKIVYPAFTKVWEAASKAVKDEEAVKQKLCEDLSNLVQESNSSQFSRLEELKRRLEAMNPGRTSTSIPQDVASITPVQSSTTPDVSLASHKTEPAAGVPDNISIQGNGGNIQVVNGHNQQPSIEGDGRGKKKSLIQGRGKGIGAVPKGRGPGWTGAGFDVDGRT